MRPLVALLVVASLAGCAASAEAPVNRDALLADARATLDDFHAAAAAADGARYFAHFAKDGVFIGTDATERWTKDEFRAYAKPHFDAGKGWKYEVLERHVDLDAKAGYAWFHERLRNAKLGECRGSGLLRREEGQWRVVQYDLTIPIPNDLAYDVAEQIRKKTPEKK